MNPITTIQPHDDLTAALENLAEMFDFALVAHCPDPECTSCVAARLADAA